MTWFKVDDAMHAHRKTRRAGLEALGLWAVAGSWASQQNTEGFVPEWFVEGWPKGKALAKKLVQAGFWDEAVDDGEKGWRFHDWLDFNPSLEDVERRRKEAAERQKRFRRNKASGRYVQDDVTRYVTDNVTGYVTPPRPDPSRPDPGKSLGGVPPESNGGARPPLYPNHCQKHRNVAEPGPCGDCADRRRAIEATPMSIRIMTPCLIHMEPDVATCRGCAADAKAAPGS